MIIVLFMVDAVFVNHLLLEPPQKLITKHVRQRAGEEPSPHMIKPSLKLMKSHVEQLPARKGKVKLLPPRVPWAYAMGVETQQSEDQMQSCCHRHEGSP